MLDTSLTAENNKTSYYFNRVCNKQWLGVSTLNASRLGCSVDDGRLGACQTRVSLISGRFCQWLLDAVIHLIGQLK